MSVRLRDILLNPAFLSLLIGVGIVCLLPDIFQKYKVEEVNHREMVFGSWSSIVSSDLDGDGFSEFLKFQYNQNDEPSFVTYSKECLSVGQFNVQGRMIDGLPFWYFVGDYNSDGGMEVFVASRKQDSILLTIFDVVNDRTIVSERLVGLLENFEEEKQFGFNFYGFGDSEGGDEGCIYFCIDGFFNLQPRGVYRYDIENDLLEKSPAMRVPPLISSFLETDQGEMIFINNYACDNGGLEHIPYTDHASWLMVLDHNMDFLFEPSSVEGVAGSTISYPFIKGNDTLINAFSFHFHGEGSHDFVRSFDMKGALVDSAAIKDFTIKSLFEISNAGDRAVLIQTGLLDYYLLNDDIHAFEKIDFDLEEDIYYFKSLDIDRDGKEEHFFYDINKNFYVLRNDFSKPIQLITQNRYSPYNVINASIIEYGGQGNRFLIQNGDREFIFEYQKNPLYYLKYPIWLLIIVLVRALVYLLNFTVRRNLERKYKMELQIRDLHLKSVRSQMDPHFTFNALNTVTATFMEDNPKGAYEYILKFSKLLRGLFANPETVMSTLDEEIDFVKNYLEMQKIRYGDNFYCIFELDPDIDTQIPFPKMIMQLICENALKHGLFHKEGPGTLWVKVKSSETGIKISIEDNGIGREKARKYSNSTGRGMHLISEMIKHYNETENGSLSMQVEDREFGGTVVVLLFSSRKK
jgi:hypothetical protein